VFELVKNVEKASQPHSPEKFQQSTWLLILYSYATV